MKNKLKTKRSFTLIEVLTVIALISITGTIIVSILSVSGNMFGLLTNKIEAKMKADQAIKIIIAQVRFSKDLELSDNEDILYIEPDKRKIFNKDGKLLITTSDGNTQDLFSEEFYDNYTLSIRAKKIENNLLLLTCGIDMKGDDSVNYSISTAVEAYNTDSISGFEGSILSYYWDKPD